ncbi:MAG: 16S rRNA (cytosine(1402)-N(4))-methyltransferase RsmH [Synergistaceae bacterium]|nr:16S rRNA (cytosine(1402)-N(4))-methyltransferase RsmH [Synergistaceae bacterium]
MLHHEPVMLSEVLSLLSNYPHAKILDGTLGLGGYSEAILEAFPGSEVLGIDRDNEAVKFSRERLKVYGSRFTAMLQNFGRLSEIPGIDGYDAYVFDLGVSNMQLALPERGFSFNADGPLDMRMNPDDDSCPTAAEILNNSDAETLTEIFRLYGEERYARKIASAIKRHPPITRTSELVDLIRETLPQPVQRKMGTHPARRVFQALRIYVNNETGELEALLKSLREVSAMREAVILFVSYHSLEDRLIKRAFREWQGEGIGKVLTRHPMTPSPEETERNYKARSAKLRAFFTSRD